MTPYKKLLLKLSLAFVGLVLLFTFFSKTIYNFNLANVTVEYPESGSMLYSATGRGTVEFALEDTYYANATGSIYPLVEAGQTVSAGDSLYTIIEPVDQLEDALEDRLHQRETLSLQLTNAQTNLDNATENLYGASAVDPIADQDLASLDLAIQSAQAELLSWENYYADQARYQEEAADQALDALEQDYRQQLEMAEDEAERDRIQDAYQQDRAQLETEQAMAAETFAFQCQQDLDARKIALKNLQLEYQQVYDQKRAALNSQSQNLSGLEYQVDQVQLEIRENEREITKLQQQIAGGGEITVTAENDGQISRLGTGISRGAPVSQGQQILSVGVLSEGFRTSVSLPNTVDYLQIGDTVQVNVRTQELYNLVGQIASLHAVDGRLQVEVDFTAEGLSGGEATEITVQNTSDLYDAILPNSAIRVDTDGEYVLYVEKVEGFWRDTYYARYMSVIVREQNNYQAGVIIPNGKRLPIIINSDRAISEGDQVRLVSGSDLLETR